MSKMYLWKSGKEGRRDWDWTTKNPELHATELVLHLKHPHGAFYRNGKRR